MGIDYGHGKTNIDKKTNIRYEVINQNEVLQAFGDSSEPWYGTYECSCGTEYALEENGFECPKCEEQAPEDLEPVSWYIKDNEYIAEVDNYGDIFIIKSPYYTKCNFCSPCAPGAGDIINQGNDARAYCFGHDWFEDEITPYKVYSVKTGNLVLPFEKEGKDNEEGKNT